MFEAHRYFNHSTLGSKAIKKKRSTRTRCQANIVVVPQKVITNKLLVHAHTRRGAARAEDTHGIPTQYEEHITSMLVYEEQQLFCGAAGDAQVPCRCTRISCPWKFHDIYV